MSVRRDLALRLLRYSAVHRGIERVIPWLSRAESSLEHALVRHEEQRRAKPVDTADTPHRVAGLVYVEFIGPSGVGKSTLANALIASDEVSVALAPVGGLIDWTSLELPRLRPADVSPILDEMYLEILNRKMTTVLKEESSADAVAGLMKFFAGNLREDLRLASSKASGNVLRGDGLLHNFGRIVLELGRQDDRIVRRVAKERVIVSCTAPLDLITDRVISRETAGGSRPQYLGRSRQEVNEHVAASLLRLESTVEAFRQWNAVVIEADISAPDLAELAVRLRHAISECRRRQEPR